MWGIIPEASGIKLRYKIDSVVEFYRLAQTVSLTGNKDKHADMIDPRRDVRWQNLDQKFKWYGVKELEDLQKRKFAFKDNVDKIEKETNHMVQGYRKRVYKYDELDGDDINMERLYEHLPAMIKRDYAKGDKWGNFITLFFNVGVDCSVSAEAIKIKTKTIVKLIKFFESIGKRTEVILFFKAINPGRYKGESVGEFVLELTAKRFSQPLNLSLLNTLLSPWFFRYWILAFMDTRMNVNLGHGSPGDMNKDDYKRYKGNKVIEIGGYSCLTEENSESFINEILENEKTSTI